MSRLFESFEFLNRGWDVRVLEGQPPRTIFVFLLIDVFLLGAFTLMVIVNSVHMQRFEWGRGFLILTFILPVVRYSHLIWRRLAG